MNKKGFTMIELLGAISILSILMGIAVAAVTKYQLKARDAVYKNHEKNMKTATENYLLDNQGDIPSLGNSKKINVSDLIDGQYLERLNDPVSKELDCNSGSYIIVKNKSELKSDEDSTNIKNYYDANGNLIESNTENLDLEYTVCLKCSDYISSSCTE